MRLDAVGDDRDQLHTVQALSRIKTQLPHEFDVVVRALKSNLAATDEELREAEGVYLQRLQGRAQFAVECIDLWSDCQQVLRNLRGKLRPRSDTASHGPIGVQS